MKTYLSYILLMFVLLVALHINGQQVTWGFPLGSTQSDYVQNSHIDATGNVYIVGEFRGTNVDFDPSPATALRSSNGNGDGFLSIYNSSGQFLNCITIGGSNLDKVQNVTTDATGNIYICGFFRGSNVDFDPSPATAYLSSNGDSGPDPGYGGDIFMAKYTPAGQFLWAFNIGGGSLYDDCLYIKSDAAGNLFVAGYFSQNVDFDPSPASAFLNSAAGTTFLAHYNTLGQYQWAFNLGGGDISNAIFDIKLDAVNNVYVTGYFQGVNIDFDPSAGTTFLSSAGNYEAFVAKYSSAGQYRFAFKIGGSGLDVGRSLTLDNNGNIYVIGDFEGSNIDFDPSSTTHALNSNGAADVFVGKYTNDGQYIWAFNAGSNGGEFGWRIQTDNAHIYITGGFTGISDFNPSIATDNLTSNGGYDIFLVKYDMSGNYECGFNVGGP